LLKREALVALPPKDVRPTEPLLNDEPPSVELLNDERPNAELPVAEWPSEEELALKRLFSKLDMKCEPPVMRDDELDAPAAPRLNAFMLPEVLAPGRDVPALVPDERKLLDAPLVGAPPRLANECQLPSAALAGRAPYEGDPERLALIPFAPPDRLPP
jgi:hypothetical protein